jgi:hypothetical protein
MPNATVRANARTLPKSTKSAPASESLRALYRPGVLERGLKIIAKAQDEVAAKKDAPAPEAAADEYNRLGTAKIIADALFEVAAEKMKAEAAAKDEEPKLEASRAFAQAFHAWLAAKAGIEEPAIAEEEQPGRFRAESYSERSLFTTPAVYPDQLWQKLEAFEAILGGELMSGQKRDSILLLALGSIKQDILNLELLEAMR